MANFLDMVHKESKEEGEKFIKMLKSNKIKKRILPNESEDFALENALKNFDHLTKSKEFQDSIKGAYKRKRESK